jgi:hypothetical protein
MVTYSKATDETLRPYDGLPHNQHFDSMISDTKFTADTRTDFYDRGLRSRRYALVAVACSSIFSCSCIIGSIVILAKHGVSGVATANTSSLDCTLHTQKEIFSMILNLIVTLCTESIGFVHGISLRSALASESRLLFNTNLRLLTAARGWCSPNGILLNGISAILLIISYCSASLVVCFDFSSTFQISIAGIPLLILGVALLLQVVIALSAMRAVKILTWSSSPFHLTAALVHHEQLIPATLRCMRCVSDLDICGGPTQPREIQPSAWRACPRIRKVVIFLWVVVATCAGWAALAMYIWDKFGMYILDKFAMHIWDEFASLYQITSDALTPQTWSFLSTTLQSNFIMIGIYGVSLGTWILLFVIMAIFQGPLTLALHCSELITNVIRDEREWRRATGMKGLRTATNPAKMIFAHPICLVLFVAKPFLRESFSSSLFYQCY